MGDGTFAAKALHIFWIKWQFYSIGLLCCARGKFCVLSSWNQQCNGAAGLCMCSLLMLKLTCKYVLTWDQRDSSEISFLSRYYKNLAHYKCKDKNTREIWSDFKAGRSLLTWLCLKWRLQHADPVRPVRSFPVISKPVIPACLYQIIF